MNKTALAIPRPGATSAMIQQGYVDALRYLGWTVYVVDPKTKLGCQKLIEEYGVGLIMTFSRYGMRQLPIETINDNDVIVIVDVLPLNDDNLTIDGPYEFAHDDEPDLVKEIKTVVVHTRLSNHLWPTHMCGWQKNNIDLVYLPVAGNMIKALPPTCSVLTDVAMVANFTHRPNIMKLLIEPLFKRLDLLGYSYQAFGDNLWNLAGLKYNGPLINADDRLAHVYATAKVCPNVHTETQVKLQAYVNERSFMIPLCGGVQVSDNPMVLEHLGSYCEVATSTTDYMNRIISLIEDDSHRFDRIKAGLEDVSNNHTYFNRLIDLFRKAGLTEYATEVLQEGQRAAIRHCWEVNARLSAEERGIRYEPKVVGAA
jgi:spore maturation protein CgeB